MATKLLRDWEILTGDEMKAMVGATKVAPPGIRCYNIVNELGERQLAEIHVHRSHLPLLPGYKPSTGQPTQHVQALPPSLRAWLRPYQLDAVQFITARAGTILADDLGLGKTAIASASCGEAYTTIVCPSSAIIVWEQECRRMGWTYRVLDKKATRDTLRNIATLGTEIPQALIISYSLLPALAGSLVLGSQWQTHTLIADEAHQLTNKHVTWAKMFRMIHRERTILLTATPMRNRLQSLWGLLDCACYGAFGSEWDFRKHYCGATMGEYALENGEPTNQEELALRLTEVVIKRTRAQVQIPLPAHERTLIECPIPAKVLTECLAAVGQRRGAEAIRALGALRVAIGKAKAQEALKQLDGMVDEYGRVILWVWHHEVADLLKLWNRPGVKVDVLLGDTNSKVRAKIVDEWRAGDYHQSRVLIASIGAAATAISLTTARLAVFIELDWTPMNLIQAEKRHYRFGNVFPSIKTAYMVGNVSVERQMISALLEKAEASELALQADGSVEQIRALLKDVPVTEQTLASRWLREVHS